MSTGTKSRHSTRTLRMSSAATCTGSCCPGAGHWSTGTRESCTITVSLGMPGTSNSNCNEHRPSRASVGGSETSSTVAVPRSHCRGVRRKLLATRALNASTPIAMPATRTAWDPPPSPKQATNIPTNRHMPATMRRIATMPGRFLATVASSRMLAVT